MLSLVPDGIELESGKIDLKEATVLDIGSGPGILAERIKDKVAKVIAIDREENMTKDVKERLAQAGKVEVLRGDFLEIPLADSSVDLVLSGGTVWYIPIERRGADGHNLEPSQIEDMFLAESLRVLKPGGVYIFDGVWNGQDDDVARNFSAEREKEIEFIKQRSQKAREETGQDLPLTKRNFVILSLGLEERLVSLGYRCKVELPNCGNGKNCCARITLLEKINSQ
jgi:SAM-dependent methyltransferase